jgi:hypothetical protein
MEIITHLQAGADEPRPPLPPHPLTYLPPAEAARWLADVAELAALRAAWRDEGRDGSR